MILISDLLYGGPQTDGRVDTIANPFFQLSGHRQLNMLRLCSGVDSIICPITKSGGKNVCKDFK